MGKSSQAEDLRRDDSSHTPPCEDLDTLRARVISCEVELGTQEDSLRQTHQQIGEMLIGIGEAATNAKEAHREASMARHAAERVAAQVLTPINKMLERYQHDSNPPLDYGDTAGEFTKNQPLPEIVRRTKHAEKENERLEAEVRRIELEAKIEAARIVAEAEAEKKRVEKEAALELERLARKRERDRLIHAALAVAGAIATAVTTYFAARGH